MVQTYDRLSFFTPQFQKVANIKQYHQFKVSSTMPCTILCKDYSDSEGRVISLLKNPLSTVYPFPSCLHLGFRLSNNGTSMRKIRLASQDVKHNVSLPSMPRPQKTSTVTPMHIPPIFPSHASPPATKWAYVCSKCGSGHKCTCQQSLLLFIF